MGTADRVIKSIHQKVIHGKRLNRNDGIALMKSDDILSIGYIADEVRKMLHGDYVYFTHNLNINPTNICVNRCSLCAFYKTSHDEEAYTLSMDDIEERVRWAKESGVREFHIVGGLNPDIAFDFYLQIIKRIKIIDPEAFIQGFTAVEIDYFSNRTGLTVDEVLMRLYDAGLGSLPGGGAEVFSPRVRQLICPNKISGERWLNIHKIAHSLGISSNATMLYGHIERDEELIDHILALRELQDETNGFLAFVPLAFHSKNTGLAHISATTGFKDLKVISVARLILDNFPHIRLLWTYVGEKLTQVALNFGVDDLGGTSIDENIVRAAGANGDEKSFDDMISLIRSSGRIPMPVNSVYESHTVNTRGRAVVIER